MKELLWNQAEFVGSGTTPDTFPKLLDLSGKPLYEVAIVGRSNVGKSSLLNDLFSRRNLARVSSTPGKTQLINFFRLGDAFAFIDLPGYGFAKVSKEVKKAWGKLVQEYLQKRETLSLIILLLDIRREEPSPEDLLFIQWALFHKKQLLLVFTKTDKVSAQEKKRNSEAVLSCLPNKETPVIYYSTITHDGQKELRNRLKGLCNNNLHERIS